MASRTLLPWSFFLLLTVAWSGQCVDEEPQVPCYFIFGDSLVDGGNNNNLATSAKVDYEPYGIDFPHGPTGRFCNGKTTADIIGELLGFDDFIPSFLTAASASDTLKGVNYASGSAGIRVETGKIMGVNVELSKQIENHQVTISRIVDMLGNNVSATNYLNKCLYSFVIGSNDYINNYFLPQYYNTSTEYTPEQYAEALINEYTQQIRTMYNLGARKVALTGIGPIGCTPNSMANNDRRGSLCADDMNEAANLFDDRLQSLVNELNDNLTDANFVYLNTYGIMSEYPVSSGRLIKHESVNPASPGRVIKDEAMNVVTFGIDELKITGCCKVNEYGLCIPGEAPCKHRNLHMFWDAFHPTEIANEISAGVSYLALRQILSDVQAS